MTITTPAVVVGGGASLIGFDWQCLDDAFVIAINRAFQKLPNAQIVYFTDEKFWNPYKEELLEHKGLLIRGARHPENEFQHQRVMYFELPACLGLTLEPGKLHHGNNSPYAAINLAVQMGFKVIYTLGLDMHHEGGKTHFHSGYGRNSANYNFADNYKSLVEPLKELGVTVINVGMTSKLDCFPKISIEDFYKIMEEEHREGSPGE